MSEAKTKRVQKLLQWMLDHNQEGQAVDIGCKTCKETTHLMASTALTAWLQPFHYGHDVWIRNPFRKAS